MSEPEAPTLGNSSHVVISENAMKAYHGSLPHKRKKELRREAIMAYIKHQPVGARIKLEEFASVGSFNSDAAADAFVKRMVRDGLVGKENITPRTYHFWVIQDETVRVVKGPDPKKMRYTVTEIEDKAKEFSWSETDDNNNLRAFISALKKEQQDEVRKRNEQSAKSASGSQNAQGAQG